jgi:Icc-related predicted phosphoesterase
VDFLSWFSEQPHKHKLLIAGNHDGLFETEPRWCKGKMPDNITYLQDSGCEIDGIKFWGSPWQPAFNNWHFNLPRNGHELEEMWALIPDDTDVLITHGPPNGILDECPDWHPRFGSNGKQVHAGCEKLAEALPRINPKAHIFGHIHEGAGVLDKDGCMHINASHLDRRYNPIHPPRVLDL